MATIQTEATLNTNVSTNVATNTDQDITGDILRDEFLDLIKSANLRKRDMTTGSGNIKLDDRNGYLYGFDSVVTGNITIDDTTLVVGATSIIKHNHTSAPTFTAATATVTEFGGNYIPSQNNYYIIKVVSATEVLVQLIDNTSYYIRFGTADPEGNETAPQGCVYIRFGAGYNRVLYIKESGVGNTGWRAIHADGGIYVVEGTTLDLTTDPEQYDGAIIILHSYAGLGTDTILSIPAAADIDTDWNIRIHFLKEPTGNPIKLQHANDTDPAVALVSIPYQWTDEGSYKQLQIGTGTERHQGAFSLVKETAFVAIPGFYLIDYTTSDRFDWVQQSNDAGTTLPFVRTSQNMTFEPSKAYTATTIAGFRNGQSSRVRITQPGGGPYDIPLPANVVFAASDPYCKDSSGNKITDMSAAQVIDVEIHYDGTDYYIRTIANYG